MKKSLNILLILLVAFPWSAISAGACPMRHGDAKARSTPEKKPGCCTPKQVSESQQRSQNDQHNKSFPCSGDCCPVCHLVQDTPQVNSDHQILPDFYPKVTGLISEQFAATPASVTLHSIDPSSARVIHLNIPIRVPLRI